MKLCIIGGLQSPWDAQGLGADAYECKTYEMGQAKQIADNANCALLGSNIDNVQEIVPELLRAGISVIAEGAHMCTSKEWEKLESIAEKHSQRLLCCSHVHRFNPKIKSMGGGVVRADAQGNTDTVRTLAEVVDVAVMLNGGQPQVVFASAWPKDDILDYQHAGAMIRFENRVYALVSSQHANISQTKITLQSTDNGIEFEHTDGQSAMLEYVASGALPDAPESKQQVMSASCSRLAGILEGLVVSINTGAPVYTNQT